MPDVAIARGCAKMWASESHFVGLHRQFNPPRRLFFGAPSLVVLGWSFLFHHALQRMLVFSGKVHHLRHFCLGHLVRINAAFADSMVMDVEHDAGRAFAILVEESL